MFLFLRKHRCSSAEAQTEVTCPLFTRWVFEDFGWIFYHYFKSFQQHLPLVFVFSFCIQFLHQLSKLLCLTSELWGVSGQRWESDSCEWNLLLPVSLKLLFVFQRIEGISSQFVMCVCFLFLIPSTVDSFFKKRQQEKQTRRPRGDGDDESVEDVDDDEFEKILGELRHSGQWESGFSFTLRGRRGCYNKQCLVCDVSEQTLNWTHCSVSDKHFIINCNQAQSQQKLVRNI